jgi:hypothetical protein
MMPRVSSEPCDARRAKEGESRRRSYRRGNKKDGLLLELTLFLVITCNRSVRGRVG